MQQRADPFQRTMRPHQTLRSFDLQNWMRRRIVASLSGDVCQQLLNDFDIDRRADLFPFSRSAAFGVAYAVVNDFQDNPLYGDDDAWESVARMFDMICDLQRDDGCWNWHVTATGQTHRFSYPTAMMSWLRYFEMFADRIDTPRRGRIETMLRRAAEVFYAAAERYIDTGETSVGRNILISNGFSLHLAGRLFGVSDWVDVGARVLDAIVAEQTPDGYWYDGRDRRGPTVRYNAVTLEIVAGYAHMTGDTRALDAVQRAARFHRAFAYPNGASVETIDERNRHGAVVDDRLIRSFGLFEQTRSEAAFFAERRAQQQDDAVAAHVNLCDGAIDAWRTVGRGELPLAPAESGCFDTIPAVVTRSGSWYLCLSGAATRTSSRRFHHDLQSHLSLWHDTCGLIFGGGNSMNDPLFSTFRFRDRYLATQGEVEITDTGASLCWLDGYTRATVEAHFESDNVVALTIDADGDVPDGSEFAVHLPMCGGQTLTAWGREQTLDDQAVFGVEEALPARVQVGALAIETDRPLKIIWPCMPVNVYDPPKLLANDHAVLRLGAALHHGSARILVRVDAAESEPRA